MEVQNYEDDSLLTVQYQVYGLHYSDLIFSSIQYDSTIVVDSLFNYFNNININ